jgi:HSP20 family molecular chaperone IbpA
MLNFFSRKDKTKSQPGEKEMIYFGEGEIEPLEVLAETETAKEENEEVIELPIDIIRGRGEIIMRAPVIGAKDHDVSVTVKGKQVTISKNATTLSEEGDFIVQECFWGPLSRTVTLDEPIQVDQISAKLEKGVLTVTIPLIREKTKIIHIKDEDESY